MRSIILGSLGALFLSAAPALAGVVTFNCASGKSCSATVPYDQDAYGIYIGHLSCEWISAHVNRIEVALTSTGSPSVLNKKHIVLTADERTTRAMSRLVEMRFAVLYEYKGFFAELDRGQGFRLTLYAAQNGPNSGTCYTNY